MTQFWTFLDQIGIITGLLTFVVSILIWLKVKQKDKELQKKQFTTKATNFAHDFNKYKTINSPNAMALAICLLDTSDSIKNDVQNYLTANNLKVKKIVELNIDGIKGKKGIEDYLNKLRQKRRSALSEATEIRLFIAGPISAGVMAGAVLDNWVPVLIYQNNRGNYEYWGMLTKR